MRPPNSSLSSLARRLHEVDRVPARRWTVLVENVPSWPGGQQAPFVTLPAGWPARYADPAGTPQLRDRIAERESTWHGVGASRENVVVTAGGLHALSLVFRALYRPGAAALCQRPVLGLVGESLRACGYRLGWLDMSESGGVDLDAAAAAIGGPVGLVYLNSPHNPTGATANATALADILAAARRWNAIVVFDSVYDAFGPPSPLRTLAPELDRVVIVNSLSKNWGAPGIRIGWAVTGSELAERLASGLERDQICVSPLAQAHGAALMSVSNAALVDEVSRGRDLAVRACRDRFADVTGGGAGTQLWVRLPTSDVETFADRLLRDRAVVLVTASNYLGADGPFVRIPVVYPPDVLRRALDAVVAQIATDRSHVARRHVASSRPKDIP